MAIQKPAIFRPFYFEEPFYWLRVTVDGGSGPVTEDLRFPVSPDVLTPGREYWAVGDGQADGQEGDPQDLVGKGDLWLMLTDTLRSHSESPSFLPGLGNGDVNHGKARIGADMPFTIHWSHASTTAPALDPTIFGFVAGDISSDTNGDVFAPNRQGGMWYPYQPPTIDSRDRIVQVGGLTEVPSGLVRVARLATNVRKVRDLEWRLLRPSKGLTEFQDADDPFGSAEQMQASLHAGHPLRLYLDESTRSSSSYTLYRTRSLEDTLERDEESRVRWQIRLSLRKVKLG